MKKVTFPNGKEEKEIEIEIKMEDIEAYIQD